MQDEKFHSREALRFVGGPSDGEETHMKVSMLAVGVKDPAAWGGQEVARYLLDLANKVYRFDGFMQKSPS
jgi:hypothetical protein